MEGSSTAEVVFVSGVLLKADLGKWIPLCELVGSRRSGSHSRHLFRSLIDALLSQVLKHCPLRQRRSREIILLLWQLSFPAHPL